jgi:formylglycine-generating enzyme required for sulfatase activity
MVRILALATLLFAFPAQAFLEIDLVPVGDAGNWPCDPSDAPDDFCSGDVHYSYKIGKYEVTNAEYTEFLNAVAATDTYSLYHPDMGLLGSPKYGGIGQGGSSGSFSYDVIGGRGNYPVNYVSFYDALRFANWLHNGQPTGAQDSTTTEDGSYTFTSIDNPHDIQRNRSVATYALPNEDEWYKAAYYKGGSQSAGYWDYATSSDTPPTCTTPGPTPNTANCNLGVPTPVGAYSGSPSPYGTFDQGGNLLEWNESIYEDGFRREQRQGHMASGSISLSGPGGHSASPPSNAIIWYGFRVVKVPPYSPVPSLSTVALTVLCSLIGLLGVRKIRN